VSPVAPTRRRSVLATVAAGLAGVAGCAGATGRSGPVSLLAAGSLNNALEHGLRPAVGPDLRVEARGSAAVARLVADGAKDPDVVSVADVSLFDAPLSPDWYAEFATNSLVVAYDPDTEGGRRVRDAGPDGWFRPLADEDVSFGRTDPDLDPLGYRTLFALELASVHFDAGTDLRETVPERDQIYPETRLMGQFETGSLDAAVVYRNMAVERDLPFVELPPQVNLGDPAFGDVYAEASYELPSGQVVSGGVVSYASTVRHDRRAVREVFDEHVTGSYLTEFGFTVPDDYPRFTGEVPDGVGS
jgi:molybdate/tungstate transport system substrate-binding protein